AGASATDGACLAVAGGDRELYVPGIGAGGRHGDACLQGGGAAAAALDRARRAAPPNAGGRAAASTARAVQSGSRAHVCADVERQPTPVVSRAIGALGQFVRGPHASS